MLAQRRTMITLCLCVLLATRTWTALAFRNDKPEMNGINRTSETNCCNGSKACLFNPAPIDNLSINILNSAIQTCGTRSTLKIISNIDDLQRITNDLTADYVLVNDIDASQTKWWNGGEGFQPIGTQLNRFSGSLDGCGYIISGLFVNRSSTDYVGLFGAIGSGSSVSNVGLVNVNITGSFFVGGLVGSNDRGSISKCFTTGSINGNNTVGGLVGENLDQGASIEECYATGNVSGLDNKIGGLVGMNIQGSVSNCFATGDISGYQDIGGLVGLNWGGSVSNCYATGSVSGIDGPIGGLLGYNYQSSVSHCYATGNVSGTFAVGGLVGENYNPLYHCFWDIETSGTTIGIGEGSLQNEGTGETTINMMIQNTFTTWNFNDIWWMVNSETRPFLRMEWSTEIRTSHQLQMMQMDPTENYVLVGNIEFSNYIDNPARMWGTSSTSGAGFVPIGTDSNNFYGSFDGRNNTITGLYINRDGTNYVGFFGYIGSSGLVSNVSIVDVNIIGNEHVGGFVGFNHGSVYNSSADGSVTGVEYSGGFMGYNLGSVENCFSRTNVVRSLGSGTSFGGFAGRNFQSRIINCYSTGSVHYAGINPPQDKGFTGTIHAGGSYEMSGNFWDIETSGQTSTEGEATGRTTAEMKTKSTFTDAGWDFVNIWWIAENITYPLLK